ncbi:uncharacterized protein LOC120180975 [Hibiscus syriacus]|uniref:uncharacterized protein LOC120180975 n=1 Tax=Hibiscus syriacus TaxID=106335 RepID=UPI0019226E99|nr:uncharacterized protein LOC120180975 [Hibiscus syriacus]
MERKMMDSASGVGRFYNPPQRKYDPYLNTYNPGWRDHPNLSYEPRPSQFQRFPPEQSSLKPARDKNKHTKFRESNESIDILRESVRIPRFAKSKKEAEDKEILETFRKIKVNILETFPARFLKNCAPTRESSRVMKRIERAMLDLGASINIMPLSIYSSLNVGPLKETRVIIQLADRSNVYPEGVLEDVLVLVN